MSNFVPRRRLRVVACGIAAACLFVFMAYIIFWPGSIRSSQSASEMLMARNSGKSTMEYIRVKGRLSYLPSTNELKSMSAKELHAIFHSYLDNTEVVCKRKLRMGKVGDGGWEVCDDYEYRPIEPCIVYSFGIAYDFSFDDDVAKLYGCHVYSFDPSMGVSSGDRSPWVHFYNIGLGGEGGKLPAGAPTSWEVDSFAGIRRKLEHQKKPIDIVKMDIELSEWQALLDMCRTGELTNVRQLLVEFHLFEGSDKEEVRGRLPVLKQLEDLGFRRFHTHLNPLCIKILAGDFPVARTACYEVYYLNSRFARE